MPNSGMLDHRAYTKRIGIHWMKSWPGGTGYETLRFSRHMHNQVLSISKDYKFPKPRPHTAASLPLTANSISPFYTASLKPTCGYFYRPTTDHRRFKIGIHPSDLVSWRPYYGRPTRAQTAK